MPLRGNQLDKIRCDRRGRFAGRSPKYEVNVAPFFPAFSPFHPPETVAPRPTVSDQLENFLTRAGVGKTDRIQVVGQTPRASTACFPPGP
jgi:hypothetical protein